MLDGVEKVKDSNFGGFKSYDITNCEGHATPSSICPTVQPLICPVFQSLSSNPSIQCKDGRDLVRIEVALGEQPRDSYWDLRNQRGDKIIADVRFDAKNQTIVREVCKPYDDCYVFRLSTTGACALVSLNGNEIATAIPPEYEIKIGDSCPCGLYSDNDNIN